MKAALEFHYYKKVEKKIGLAHSSSWYVKHEFKYWYHISIFRRFKNSILVEVRIDYKVIIQFIILPKCLCRIIQYIITNLKCLSNRSTNIRITPNICITDQYLSLLKHSQESFLGFLFPLLILLLIALLSKMLMGKCLCGRESAMDSDNYSLLLKYSWKVMNLNGSSLYIPQHIYHPI